MADKLTVVTDKRLELYHELLTEKISRDISSAIANVIADAPTAFDTLKELADWIQGNEGAVMGAESRIENLENKVGDGFKNITTSYINALFANYNVDLLKNTGYTTDDLALLLAISQVTLIAKVDSSFVGFIYDGNTTINPIEIPVGTTKYELTQNGVNEAEVTTKVLTIAQANIYAIK